MKDPDALVEGNWTSICFLKTFTSQTKKRQTYFQVFVAVFLSLGIKSKTSDQLMNGILNCHVVFNTLFVLSPASVSSSFCFLKLC